MRAEADAEAIIEAEAETEAKVERSSKRQRVRRACLPCRQKKVKCDGHFPCGYCKKFNRECTPPFQSAMPAKPRAIMPTAQQQQQQSRMALQTPPPTSAPLPVASTFPPPIHLPPLQVSMTVHRPHFPWLASSRVSPHCCVLN